MTAMSKVKAAPAPLDARATVQAQRRTFDAVGAFLAEHRLEPSPANYLLAHQVVTRSNARAVSCVTDLTAGGIRLSQDDADHILAETGGAPPSEEAAAGACTIEQARHQLELIAGIIGSAQTEAAQYRSDLQSSAAQLTALPITQSIERLLTLTTGMIERAQLAEMNLHKATDEIDALREQLASASAEARTDPLTGLPNRRRLEERFAELRDAGTPLCAAVCDIDGFKLINDRHSHIVGDRVLKAVARVLEENCRGHFVARYGGEEFVVLLEGMSLEASAALIDAARADLAARRFKVRETGSDVGVVTLSAGVAEAGEAETCTDLLRRADTLLYTAKAAGKNQVEAEQAAHDLTDV